MKKEVLIYSTSSGKEPLTEWVNGLKDVSSRSRIRTRFARILNGNLGECKYLCDGVSELKLNFGPGYRIYYSDLDSIILLLLCGGDKSSQSRDIKKAINYLNDYKERTK